MVETDGSGGHVNPVRIYDPRSEAHELCAHGVKGGVSGTNADPPGGITLEADTQRNPHQQTRQWLEHRPGIPGRRPGHCGTPRQLIRSRARIQSPGKGRSAEGVKGTLENTDIGAAAVGRGHPLFPIKTPGFPAEFPLQFRLQVGEAAGQPEFFLIPGQQGIHIEPRERHGDLRVIQSGGRTGILRDCHDPVAGIIGSP